MTMKKQQYTLIEMLVVISIIAVLAGLLFPAINHSRERARETQALAGANTLSMALQQYKTTYYKFPTTLAGSLIGGTTNTQNYDNLVYYISGEWPKSAVQNSKPTDLTTHNRKKTRFMNLPSECFLPGSDPNARAFYSNPWGERYYVYLNNGSGSFNFTFNGRTIMLNTDAAVFSDVNPRSGDYNQNPARRILTSWNGIVKF